MTDAEWLAEHLLGWRREWNEGVPCAMDPRWEWVTEEGWETKPDPTPDWAFAGQVIEAMRERGFAGELHLDTNPWCRIWRRGLDDEWSESGSTEPQAILAAARKALDGSQVRLRAKRREPDALEWDYPAGDEGDGPAVRSPEEGGNGES